MSSWWIDYENNAICGASFFPSPLNSSENGAGVDLKDAEGGVHATLSSGNVSGTNPTLDVALQESNDLSGPWTPINDFRTGDPVAFDQITTPNQLQIKTFKRSKRFVRMNAVVAGTSPVFSGVGVTICGLRKAVRKFGDPVS